MKMEIDEHQQGTFDAGVHNRVTQDFAAAAFAEDLGIRLLACGAGWCEAEMPVHARHMQQTGVVHAGAQATLADHSAGAAAITLLPADRAVVSLEFKINLLRPATGTRLWCRADVIKPGKSLLVVEASVYAESDGRRVLVSKLNVTLYTVERPKPPTRQTSESDPTRLG
jgi:uncharacterized protein (TIGR00369 family)